MVVAGRVLVTDTDSYVAKYKCWTYTMTCPVQFIFSIGVTLKKITNSNRKNHHILGKMKSETGSASTVEFVGLRFKMYGLSCGNMSQKKINGMKKYDIKKNVHHDSFLKV